jgi:hypothetical protein
VSASGNGSGVLPYRFAVVPLKHMMVDVYQRPLTSFVDKIERDFDPALVGTLAVSERSKTRYALIDGQTRAEGMKRVGLQEAPCIVYEHLTPQQEAALFAKFQTQRRGMTSASRFNAQVIAGEEQAVAINEVVEGLGYVVAHNSSEPGALRAVAALEYVYQGAMDPRAKSRKKNPELLAQTMEVIKEAWPKLPDTAKSAVMIRGLGWFLARDENVDTDRLAQRLAKTTPSELAKRAEALREGRGMSGNSPAYMAEAIESQYKRR